MAKKSRTDAELVALGIPPEQSGAPIDDGTPPKYGVAVPADPQGPVPRVVRELERAPKGSGLTRYKVRVLNYEGHPRYVLARSADEAKAHYLAVESIDARVAEARKGGGEPAAPALAVTTLAD